MGDLLYEERHVIKELVELWRTHNEPRDLVIHINELSSIWGCDRGASFFLQVYEDLRTDNRNKYAAFSALRFKQFLEDKYSEAKSSRITQLYEGLRVQARLDAEAKRQAQEEAAKAKAKEREESEIRARDDFQALGEAMAKVITREELVELGRKRADLAPFTGITYSYKSHCWNCKRPISSEIHARCPSCKYYICSFCRSCFC